MADFPSDYTYAADWIWNNRITAEKSTERRNTIFDQIDAGNGTINYVVRWQSYRTLTLEQRKNCRLGGAGQIRSARPTAGRSCL